MPALTDTMRRIAILRSEVLSLTDTLDAAGSGTIDADAQRELEDGASALMQAALSLQAAENATRRSLRTLDRHSVSAAAVAQVRGHTRTAPAARKVSHAH